VCDLCSKPGHLEIRIAAEGTDEAWDVCGACYNKPFRRPTAEDRAQTVGRLANELVDSGMKLLNTTLKEGALRCKR